MNPTITFYPVDNGDCNLIEFANGQKMIIDCKFCSSDEDEDSDNYNVIDDLLNNKIQKKHHDLPYLDVFVLTHPDQDHCLHFKDKFFLNKNPESKDGKPTQAEKDNKLILIGELWYSPRVFTEHEDELCEDALAFKEEAERRMQLYKDNSADKNKPGNRIRIIGYSDVDDLNGIPSDRISAAGDTIKEINNVTHSDMRIFIHAPFKTDVENADRNETSIVMQIRVDVENKADVGKIVFGGDAEWRVWKKIMEKTSDDINLKWNLFETPHHCSYTYFADSRDNDPEQTSLDFLDKRVGKGYIVSSSKTIKKNSDNPPCQKAKNRYIEHLKDQNDDYFCCTSVDDKQEPLVFEIKKDGVHLVEASSSNENKSGNSASSNIGKREHLYG